MGCVVAEGKLAEAAAWTYIRARRDGAALSRLTEAPGAGGNRAARACGRRGRSSSHLHQDQYKTPKQIQQK